MLPLISAHDSGHSFVFLISAALNLNGWIIALFRAFPTVVCIFYVQKNPFDYTRPVFDAQVNYISDFKGRLIIVKWKSTHQTFGWTLFSVHPTLIRIVGLLFKKIGLRSLGDRYDIGPGRVHVLLLQICRIGMSSDCTAQFCNITANICEWL